ncbi:MAG: hypothetical protein HOW71_18770 [Nonomuraea sp.]|nr:hypothetical protein [Nonomuraea sp.]
MAVSRALLAAVFLAAGLPAAHSATQVDDVFCPLPEFSGKTVSAGPYLADTDSFPRWIHPYPAPGAIEPTAAQRLDFAGFPSVSAFDTVGADGRPVRKVFVTYSTNVDKAITLSTEAATSGDGGATFGPPSRTPLREAPIELRDGRLFALEYYLARTGPHTARVGVLTSRSPDGEGWVRQESSVTTPDELASGGAAHGLPIELADGTILFTAYIHYAATGAYQSEVYASDDGGRTFARRGVIAPPETPFVYNETALAQTLDGSLLAVLRRDGGRFSTLHQSRSTDGGRTWSPVEPLRLPAEQDCLVRGVAPRLLLMPDGVLVLSAGRPYNWLAVAPDGIGEEWRQQTVTYRNRDGLREEHGSSGYTAVAAVGAHRLIQVFDNCKLPGVRPDGLLNETACPAHGRFENGSWYAIKRRLFTVAAPGPGRLDLAALHGSGALKIDTTLRWTSRDRPRTNPAAAFDGSTDYWSSAAAPGGGRYVLHLDRQYPINRIGISLRPGHPAGARVYVSADGREWGEPVVTIDERTDYAMRYHTVARTGAHVMVVTEPTSDCDAEIGDSCSMLNEIELYSG